MDKKFFESAKTALSDKWEKSHEKWVEEQKQKQEEQAQAVKYQCALQLQTELAEIFSNISAPLTLQQIRFRSDLMIENNGNGIDGRNIYRFRWAKRDMGRIVPEILDRIKNKLNSVILEEHRRLWNNVSNIPYPDCQFILASYPFLRKGFRVVQLQDDSLDVIVVVQT